MRSSTTMELKDISIHMIAVLILLLAIQTSGERKFLRPLFRSSSQSNGRDRSAESGRGLFKHLAMFRNLFQQPQSNVIIITRPADTPDTPTTATTATGTSRMSNSEQKSDDETDLHEDVFDTPFKFDGVSDKISQEGAQGKRKSNKRRKTYKPREHHAKTNGQKNYILDRENLREYKKGRKESNRHQQKNKNAVELKTHSQGNDNSNLLRLIDAIRFHA